MIFLTVNVFPSSPSWSAPKNRPYDQAFQHAMGNMYAFDYDRAAAQFEEAIRIEPDNPRSYVYLSSCYWMKALYLQSSLLTSAFGLPQDPYLPASGVGCPLELRGKFEDAVRRAKEKAQALINTQPQNAEAHFWLGMAEGSESVFTVTVDKKILSAKSHADKSFDQMEKAAKLDPQFKDPYFPMGMHMHVLGTRGFLTRVLLKIMGYRVSKEEGIQYVKLAMEEGRFVREDARLGLALCYMREGQWNEAIRLFQLTLQSYPQDSLLAFAVGRLQSAMGQNSGAVITFQQILQRIQEGHPGYHVLSKGDIHLRLALSLLSCGRSEEAQKEAEKAVKDVNATTVVVAASYLALGQARDLLKNRSGAVSAYQSALALNPNTPSHQKARIYINQPYDGKTPPG